VAEKAAPPTEDHDPKGKGPEGSRGGDHGGGPNARDLVFSAALFVIALLPRLYVAIAWAREPVWDGHYYDFGARRIAAGLGYSDDVVLGGQTVWHPWCHYPVGYSGFLGILYRTSGPGRASAPVANAVTGALAVVVQVARCATTPSGPASQASSPPSRRGSRTPPPHDRALAGPIHGRLALRAICP
jgi:hypothetical protein